MTTNSKLHDVSFGWKEVEAIFLGDEAHFKTYNIRRTDLTKDIVVLGRYSMMNSSYVKYIFSEKTMYAQITYLTEFLNLTFDNESQYESERNEHHTISTSILLEIRRSKLSHLIPASNLLEYQVVVYGIFVERLMNKS